LAFFPLPWSLGPFPIHNLPWPDTKGIAMATSCIHMISHINADKANVGDTVTLRGWVRTQIGRAHV